MLTISKPLSASQARTYHEREFTSEKQNYWSRDQQVYSEWQGKLSEQPPAEIRTSVLEPKTGCLQLRSSVGQ